MVKQIYQIEIESEQLGKKEELSKDIQNELNTLAEILSASIVVRRVK